MASAAVMIIKGGCMRGKARSANVRRSFSWPDGHAANRLPVVSDVLASPRISVRSAPIEGSDKTAMIGAAENCPREKGIFPIPGDTRIPIALRSFSCPPESSTPKDTATESADAPSARDTEVGPAQVHRADDPSGSGAKKLGPGVFMLDLCKTEIGPSILQRSSP